MHYVYPWDLINVLSDVIHAYKIIQQVSNGTQCQIMGPDGIYEDQKIKELGLSRIETQSNSVVTGQTVGQRLEH